jgi:hypothetical protein
MFDLLYGAKMFRFPMTILVSGSAIGDQKKAKTGSPFRAGLRRGGRIMQHPKENYKKADEGRGI